MFCGVIRSDDSFIEESYNDFMIALENFDQLNLQLKAFNENAVPLYEGFIGNILGKLKELFDKFINMIKRFIEKFMKGFRRGISNVNQGVTTCKENLKKGLEKQRAKQADSENSGKPKVVDLSGWEIKTLTEDVIDATNESIKMTSNADFAAHPDFDWYYKQCKSNPNFEKEMKNKHSKDIAFFRKYMEVGNANDVSNIYKTFSIDNYFSGDITQVNMNEDHNMDGAIKILQRCVDIIEVNSGVGDTLSKGFELIDSYNIWASATRKSIKDESAYSDKEAVQKASNTLSYCARYSAMLAGLLRTFVNFSNKVSSNTIKLSDKIVSVM